MADAAKPAKGPVQIEDEPTMEEFMQQLRKYAVVRKATDVVRRKAPQQQAALPVAAAAPAAKVTPAAGTDMASTAFVDVWDAFAVRTEELTGSSLKAECFVQDLRSAHEQWLATLSLDDVERLATVLVQ